MAHKASILAAGKFGYFLAALFVLTLCTLFCMREYFMGLIFTGLVVLMVFRLFTRKMIFNEHEFRYDGWFRTIVTPYSEIIKVESSSSIGYPADRLHGPSEFRITTKRREFWVSLLCFNNETRRKFYEKLIVRK